MIAELFKWGGAVACAVVLAGCICRIDMMKQDRNKPGWLAMYIMAAPFSGGVLIDLLTGRLVDWYACFGMAAMLLHFVMTRHFWQHGSPQYTAKR